MNIDIKTILPLAIVLPLGMGFIMPLLGRKLVRLCDLLANITTALLVCLAVMLLIGQLQLDKAAVYWMGGWQTTASGTVFGINLVLDGLSALMILVVAVVSFAATLYSTRYMDQYTGRSKYYGLFLLMVAGMNGCVLTGDIFNLFVFLEIAAVASYALVAFGCESDELEASFKYLVLGCVASSFILLGIALLYAQAGALNMAQLGERIAQIGQTPGLLVALMLLLAGLGVKAALVPFHAWLPDAHPSAPAPISAMLSGVLIKAIGVYAIVRIIFNVFGLTPELSMVLMVLGVLSMIIGVILALNQWDFKRLLAYHSISQIGYVILAIGLGTDLGILAGIFHLANHAIFKSLLFLSAGAVEYSTGTRQLEEMGGLSQKMPTTSRTSMVASMSIAGVPPFNGFFSKLLIIIACVQAGRWGFAIWAVVVSILTLASFMKVQKYAFYGKLKDKWAQVKEVPLAMQLSMILLAVLCVAMSLMLVPGLSQYLLEPARDVLANGVEKYQNAVLALLGSGT